jgi:hypothetical protein
MRKEGVRVRCMRKDLWDSELQNIRDIYNDAWEKNWGFVPMTDHELEYMAKKLRPIVIPEAVHFAEVDGRPVAVSIALPDINPILKGLNGTMGLLGTLRFLYDFYVKGTSRARLIALGVRRAFQKRGLPRAALMDNGAPMLAADTREGLLRLGVHQTTTLPYSPYQNAKQEVFWAQAEGRLLAMLEGVGELTLPLLNEATQAWVELEYHHALHTETGQTPLARFLAGPTVGRPCPSSMALRDAFRRDVRRTQRRSDGTLSLDGHRFEIPDRYRQLARVTVRYASWNLGHVTLIDEPTGVALSPLYPLDRAKNADGRRRPRQPVALDVAPADPPPSGIAPLLRKLMAQYAATGLPPADLPTEDA